MQKNNVLFNLEKDWNLLFLTSLQLYLIAIAESKVAVVNPGSTQIFKTVGWKENKVFDTKDQPPLVVDYHTGREDDHKR